MKLLFYWFMLLVGIAGLIYSWLISDAVTAGNAAVLQLQDSDVLYSIGSHWANLSPDVIPTISTVLLVLSVYKLFLMRKFQK